MKKTKLFPILLMVFFICLLQSCKTETQNTGNFSDDLSQQEKDLVSSEIMALTDNWINAHNDMDANKASELWDNSSDLMFAENGEFFPTWNSIHEYLLNFYTTTDSMKVNWEQRVIVPLSLNSASMSGYFHAIANFKSGDSFDINSMFTGVFVKKDNRWVLIHGHESVKP